MIKSKNLLVILTMALTGCGLLNNGQYINKNSTAQNTPYSFSQFSDIPVPENASMDLDQTTIFGAENEWIGKISFKTPYNVSAVFDFYMNEMPKFKWREITSSRGNISVLTYMNQYRVALIQIRPAKFNGSEVIFTMSLSPRGKRKLYNQTQQAAQQGMQQGQPGMQPTQQTQQNSVPVSQNVAQPTGFVSSDASKAMPGSLGLGSASNINYQSNSNGVGQPPRF